MPSSKRLASTVDTQEFFASPPTLPTTFVQVLPPSRVICTLPSSVPTQMICPFFGDSLNRVNRGVHFGRRIVDRDAAGFFLLLLFGIVGRQVGRNAVPRLPVIARTEQKLRADVDRALFVGAHVDGRVPVEAQFLLAIFGHRA